MRFALLVVVLFLSCRQTYAQSFPNHTITMIVPFAAGGPADVVGRILAHHLGKTLPIIVENIGRGWRQSWFEPRRSKRTGRLHAFVPEHQHGYQSGALQEAQL